MDHCSKKFVSNPAVMEKRLPISYQRTHQNQVISFSSHEEADTKMIFHSIDADIMFEKSHEKGQIIIRSADTDVLVLILYYYQQLYKA